MSFFDHWTPALMLALGLMLSGIAAIVIMAGLAHARRSQEVQFLPLFKRDRVIGAAIILGFLANVALVINFAGASPGLPGARSALADAEERLARQGRPLQVA